MASREIIWTNTAAKQRRSILAYWVDKTGSSEFSIKLLQASSKRVCYLADYPGFGQQSEFPNTRVTSLGHYSIYYQINENQIIVTAFWDNRQDPKKLYRLLQTGD